MNYKNVKCLKPLSDLRVNAAYAPGCFFRGRETRFLVCPSEEVLRGARGRRCGLGGASGRGISPVAVG